MRHELVALALLVAASPAHANTQRLVEQIGPWTVLEITDSMSGKSDRHAITRGTDGAELSVGCWRPLDPVTTIITPVYLGNAMRKVEFRVDDQPSRQVTGIYGDQCDDILP